jgi:ankyrin repeat protein
MIRTLLLLAVLCGIVSAQPLCDAVRLNQLDKLRALNAQSQEVKANLCTGNSLLHLAAASGSLDAVKILLAAGADVNQKNVSDSTPLMWALTEIEKVKVLLDAGADVNAKTKQGRTPLLIAAANVGSLDVIKLLVAKGADLKATDAQGSGALLMAANSGELAKVQFLVERGLDVNQTNGAGFTPIMLPAAFASTDILRYLISKGANVNVANRFSGEVKFGKIELIGITPLMVAAGAGNLAAVESLLAAGADVNAKDSRSMTALMFAVASDHQNPTIVKRLLEKGADVSVKDKYGDTALAWARKNGHAESIKLLAAKAPKNELPDGASTFLNTKSPVKSGTETSSKQMTDAVQAANRGAVLVLKTGQEFFNQSGCVACHHSNMASFMMPVAHAGSLNLDKDIESGIEKSTKLRWGRSEQFLLQRLDPGGAAMNVGYGALALAAANHPGDLTTDAMAINMAGQQLHDGSWPHGGIPRPPMEDSALHVTAIGVFTLAKYGPPARKAEWDERIARARKWLAAAKPITTDERAMQILGLKWAGATAAELKPYAEALAREQRPDGGWAQTRYLATDAYATGQSLYALSQASWLPGHQNVRSKAERFLCSTQKEDGSWYVKSRSPKFQPYFESGFPYAGDQWISSAATAWATMGLVSK